MLRISLNFLFNVIKPVNMHRRLTFRVPIEAIIADRAADRERWFYDLYMLVNKGAIIDIGKSMDKCSHAMFYRKTNN